MVQYNLVKYCALCRKRFVVGKGESRIRYCKPCQTKVDKESKEE